MGAGSNYRIAEGILMIRTAILAGALGGVSVIAASAPIEPGAAEHSTHASPVDKTVDPLRDFYSYVNGNFIRENPIPPAYSSWGQVQILNERNQNIIHELLQAATADTGAAPGSEERKIGDFFASGMDEAMVEKAGITPLKDELARIAALRRPSQLSVELAQLQLIGVDAAFSFGEMQDFTDSTKIIAEIAQGGLGLPDQDYYLKDDSRFVAIRKAYQEHIGRMLQLLGDTHAAAESAAREVMALETRLAAASMPVEEQRDPHAIYNMRDLPALAKGAPAIDWPRYLAASGAARVTQVNAQMPKFFAAVSHEIQSTPIAVWRNYLRWQLVHAFAPYLSSAYVAENFKLQQAVRGTKELLPRWKRVLNTENDALGYAVGHLYVKRQFPPEAKAQVVGILHGVRDALRTDLQTLPWMSEATRAKALDKLALMDERIGYPDVWRDYSKLTIDRGPYVLNVLRANAFENARELAKIGKPVDRTEWAYPPQIINAYYDDSMNNINFLAAILQPPFFDPGAPAAANYGAVGAVIGHEITHGFDDQGSQFDGHGNLVNWWSKEDDQKFQVGVDCIVNQFSSYIVDGDMHIKGKLVAGESIADLGGALLALRAFHAVPGYASAPTVDGFTPDQQFFLAYARMYGEDVRPQQARAWAASDPHPPGNYRVNGTLANVPQFAAAFGDKGAEPQRCVIW
jgi:putative endopeptidase